MVQVPRARVGQRLSTWGNRWGIKPHRSQPIPADLDLIKPPWSAPRSAQPSQRVALKRDSRRRSSRVGARRGVYAAKIVNASGR